MVSHGVASNALEATRNMDIAPSKLFEDKGHKLNAIRYLIERAKGTRFPATPALLYGELEAFFAFCGANRVPPTLGGFAVWNGVTVQRMNQIERDKSDPRSEVIGVCKETIRGFLEMCAMDGALNPIVYFHQNKVYFGAVENQQVTVVHEDNTRELTDEEFSQRVEQITLTQQPDGSYA